MYLAFAVAQRTNATVRPKNVVELALDLLP